jgi:hypothetical protein
LEKSWRERRAEASDGTIIPGVNGSRGGERGREEEEPEDAVLAERDLRFGLVEVDRFLIDVKIRTRISSIDSYIADCTASTGRSRKKGGERAARRLPSGR